MFDISIIKPNELENYAKEITQHDFFEIFSKEDYDITNKNYNYFLYFGKEEARKYIEDYVLFCNKIYPNEKIEKENYFCVLKEFKKYLEKEDVLFMYKTLYGSLYANEKSDILQKLIDANLTDKTLHPFPQSKKYFYPFFEYLESKLISLVEYDGFTLERLEAEDLMYIQECFMNTSKAKNPPFYLNSQNKTYKYSRQFIVNNILTLTHDESAFIISNNNIIVAIVYADKLENETIPLNIMTDIDYMNSDFSKGINSLKILYKDKCKKLVVKNINRGMSGSNLSTSCILSHFIMDYNNSTNVDGYTQYDLVYKYGDEDIEPLKIKKEFTFLA